MEELKFLEAVQGLIDRSEAVESGKGRAPGGLDELQREVQLRLENLRNLQAGLPPRAP